MNQLGRQSEIPRMLELWEEFPGQVKGLITASEQVLQSPRVERISGPLGASEERRGTELEPGEQCVWRPQRYESAGYPC